MHHLHRIEVLERFESAIVPAIHSDAGSFHQSTLAKLV